MPGEAGRVGGASPVACLPGNHELNTIMNANRRTIRRILRLVIGMALWLPAAADTGKNAGDSIRGRTKATNSAASRGTSEAAVPPATGPIVGPDVEMVNGHPAVRGEVLVAFQPGIGRGRADAVRKGLGAVELKELRQIGVHVWRLPPGLGVGDAVGVLKHDRDVRFAEPNLVMTLLTAGDEADPQDPAFINPSGWPFGYQEHLRHDNAETSEIHVEEAWADGFQGQEVVVAVVDTGVDLDHPDLDDRLYLDSANTVVGGNFLSKALPAAGGRDARAMGRGGKPGKPSSAPKSPQDDHGHGTHVAGLIAAEMNNMSEVLLETPEATAAWAGGVVGVAPLARIMPVKVLDESGSGTMDGIAQGILFAADNGAQVINLSLGGGFTQTMSDALEYAWVTRDVVVIAAAGNSASEYPEFPASDLHALAVAAVNPADQCAGFSNRGGWVDIAAPGVEVLSCLIDGTGPYNGGYGRMSGTSMASPVTAGVAALIRAARPAWTAEQTAEQLLASVENIDLANPGLEGKLGTGRVNAFAAVDSVAAPIAAVQGLGAPGGTLSAVGPGDEIRVQFSHAVPSGEALDIGNYQLSHDGAPITLEMVSTEYVPFPGQSVGLRVTQELAAGVYEFVVAPALVAGGHTHTFSIVPAALTGFRAVLPVGSLAYRASVTGRFRPVNIAGLGGELEPNEPPADADPLPGWYEVTTGAYRTVLSASIDPSDDADHYEVQAAAGDVVTIAMKALDPSGQLDCYLELLDADGAVLLQNDDDIEEMILTGGMDSRIADFVLPTTGRYSIRATSFNGASSGAYKLVVDLVTGSPPLPSAGSLPDPAVAMFSFDLDAGQSVTTRVRADTPVSVALFHAGAGGTVDVTPAEDHDPGLGVLHQLAGPLDAGSVVVCLWPGDPFSTEEYAIEVLLNGAFEEAGDNDSPERAQVVDPCWEPLHENAPGSERASIAGNLFDFPRVHAETPGTTGDLSGSWDRVDGNTFAINVRDGNPGSPLGVGVTGTITAAKNSIEFDQWQVELTEGDLFSVKPWGAEEGGGTASDLSITMRVHLGDGWTRTYSGRELNNIRIPSTGRCAITVRCASKRSVGTYTLTAQVVSDTEKQVDAADYYALDVAPGGNVEVTGDPRVRVDVAWPSPVGGQCIVKVTPNGIGHIDYGLALTVDATLDQAGGNEAPETAPLLRHAALGHVGGGVAGYFTDTNEGTHAPEQAITRAGLMPLHVADIASCDLAAIRFLMLDTLNGHPSSALLGRLPDIEAWVRGGGVLVVHDRHVSSGEGVAEANPLLVGAPATMLELNFEFGPDLDIIRSDTLVTDGPGGEIGDTTLDGGYYSNHGFAHADTLPPGAVAILSAGPGADRVAAFSYPLDDGHVYYSTIPLDFYLDYYLDGGDTDPLIRSFCEVYAPNVLAYAKSLGFADREDWYTLGELEPGVQIALETATPADGAGQFDNLLDPEVTLFRLAGGTPVPVEGAVTGLPGTHNERVSHDVTTDNPGTYLLRVRAEGPHPGEYMLLPVPTGP